MRTITRVHDPSQRQHSDVLFYYVVRTSGSKRALCAYLPAQVNPLHRVSGVVHASPTLRATPADGVNLIPYIKLLGVE
jgi:hypothetical protein